MTITTNPARNEYTATAGQTVFSYTFKIYEDSDLNVYQTPAGQTANDSTDLITGYTVTGAGVSTGGTITLSTPASAGDLITIVSDIPDSRTTDYQVNGDFRPDVVNDDFDRVVSLVKQSVERANRGLAFAESQQGAQGFSLPAPQSGYFLRWNGTLDGLENVPFFSASPGSSNLTVSMLGGITGQDAGDWIFCLGKTTIGDGGHGVFVWRLGDFTSEVSSDTLSGIYAPSNGDPTGSTGCWIRQLDNIGTISTAYFGDYADGLTNDYPAITAALNYAAFIRDSAISAPIVKLRPNASYLIDTGVVVPHGVTLDCQGSYISYSGSDVAVTAGDRSDALNYYTNVTNFFIKLNDDDATGLRTLATTRSNYTGTVEGYTANLVPGVNPGRTCVGVKIDGGSVSSFGNTYEVLNNHIHRSFFFTSSGAAGSQPTGHTFINCSINGDHYLSGSLTDDTSEGFYFDGLSLAGLGSGTYVFSTNIENVGIGAYFGAGTRDVTLDCRWELGTASTNSRIAELATGVTGITLRGSGLEAATMGAVAGGIEGFGNGYNYVVDTNGHIRTVGNDTNITSGEPTLCLGQKNIILPKDNAFSILTKETDTGTGEIYVQPGSGSSANGSYFALHGQVHATQPGNFLCGFGAGSGGKFAVTNGFGGDDIFVVDTTSIRPGADNTYSAGQVPYRYTAVYAVNGAIQTSDEREKTDIAPINDALLDAWEEVNFIQYRWNKDDGKLHVGVIAQQIEKVFKAHGLNAVDYGILYYDDEHDVYSVSYSECMILEMASLRRARKEY